MLMEMGIKLIPIFIKLMFRTMIETQEALIVPEDALVNKHAFKDWFITAYTRLFEKKIQVRLELEEFPTEPEKAKELLAAIISHVNFINNGKYEIPSRFDASKSRRYSNKDSDVISLTVCIILDTYTISKSQLGKLLKLDHSTIIYYRNKVNDMLSVSKSFREAYLRTAISLQKHGLIAKVKITDPKVRDYVKKANTDLMIK